MLFTAQHGHRHRHQDAARADAQKSRRRAPEQTYRRARENSFMAA